MSLQPFHLAPEPPQRAARPPRSLPAGAGPARGAAGGVPAPSVPDADPALLVRVALLDLYAAHRAPGEDYPQCFARLGAPGYAALLAEVLAVPRPVVPPRPAWLAQAPLPR